MGKAKKSKKLGEFEWSRETRRVIPLQANHVYIFDDKGKRRHLKRDSEEFNQTVAELDEKMDGRITREMKELGWL